MVINGKESTNNLSDVLPHAHRAKPDSSSFPEELHSQYSLPLKVKEFFSSSTRKFLNLIQLLNCSLPNYCHKLHERAVWLQKWQETRWADCLWSPAGVIPTDQHREVPVCSVWQINNHSFPRIAYGSFYQTKQLLIFLRCLPNRYNSWNISILGITITLSDFTRKMTSVWRSEQHLLCKCCTRDSTEEYLLSLFFKQRNEKTLSGKREAAKLGRRFIHFISPL